MKVSEYRTIKALIECLAQPTICNGKKVILVDGQMLMDKIHDIYGDNLINDCPEETDNEFIDDDWDGK